MRGVNQHTVLGTLGRDPELRTMPNGGSVTNFSLAVNEVWRDKQTGEQKENVEWVSCVAFNKAAEIIAEYCKKGQPLYIQGRQRTRKWQDKNGNDRYTTETLVDTFQLIAGSGSGGAGQRQADEQRQEQHEASAPVGQGGAPDFDDDIPF